MFAVTLNSSADSLCPGDGVVFTCVTDTGQLNWGIGLTVRQFYYNAANSTYNALISVLSTQQFTIHVINTPRNLLPNTNTCFVILATEHSLSKNSVESKIIMNIIIMLQAHHSSLS